MRGAPKKSSAQGARPAAAKPEPMDEAAVSATRDRLTLQDLEASAARNRQWGRWGPDDEFGTLNHITPEAVAAAARLVRRGQVFALALNFDANGPQRGPVRFNPIHTMSFTGSDACLGHTDWLGLRFADDIVTMPLQCGTQWDGLAHVFYQDRMWNGYDARLVTASGAARNGIEKVRDRLVGRGVLLDVPRFLSLPWLPDGYGISAEDLQHCAAAQKVEIRRGDLLLVRTGQMERCLGQHDWGIYAGGDAPGLKFSTADWVRRAELAAVATDTWGVEVRPNEIPGTFQPWHTVAIPMIGLTLGERFYLKDLAEECARDGVYEFLLCAAPLPFTGAVGSPANPIAIK